MKNNYFEKKAARIDRLQNLAAKNADLSNLSYDRAKQLGDMIPSGQPILVGHHSEGRHRRHIQKIDNAMRASVEASNKAEYYRERLEAAESNTAISSDNPDALQLLKEKLEKLQAYQETMKAVNKIIKGKGTPAEKVELIKAYMPEKYAVQIITPDQWNRVGFPSYKLTNNNGNMARIKDRIKQLERVEQMADVDETHGEVRIFASKDTNRVQIFFPGKPSEEVRTQLKNNGFRWAHTEGAWQRNLSNWAMQQARSIVSSLK